MIAEKISIYLAILVLTPLVGSRHACRHKVLSDDSEWKSTHKTQEPDYTDNEIFYEDYRICESQECQKIATEFLIGMNKSMDPCEDFYEYTCGGWSENISIPPSSMFWNHDTLYQNIVYYRLKKILETKPTSSDILPVKQAKKWYQSCMDTEMLQKRGLRSIESIVMQAGGWPMSMEDEEWDTDGYLWQNVESYYARLTGIHAFYNVDVNPVPPAAEDDFAEIRIGPPNLLSRVAMMNHRSYKKGLIAKVLDVFMRHSRVTMPKKSYMTELEDLMEFELSLRTLIVTTGSGDTPSSDENIYRHDTNMTLDEFSDWYQTYTMELNEDPKTRIDWTSMIQSLFDTANIKVDPSTPVYINNFAYVKGISELLLQTPARTIVNYVHWNFIVTMLTYTTDDMREQLFMMQYEHFGVRQSEPRWLECTKQMKMTYAAGYIFVNKYFPNSTESATLDMLNNIQISLTENIEKSNWLDADSKAFAKDKLKNMKLFLGIPDWYRNETAVINYYKGVTIRDDYFDNALSFMKYQMKHNLKLYVKPEPRVDLTTWFADPITVNAEYGTGNSLNLPPVNFQPPLFTPGLPDYVNYGLAGFTIGHEMGHGFDHKGIKFGKDHEDTELSDDILNSYYQRADCFIKQFEGYFNESESNTSESDNSQETRGWLTRGENIADTTGLQAVFHAYKKLNKKKPNGDAKLPGFQEFNDDQLFFISYATAWCGIERPEYTELEDQSHEPHSPGRFRVIGAVSNTRDFAKVFNCRKGSTMNPINKCSIWKKPPNKISVDSEVP